MRLFFVAAIAIANFALGPAHADVKAGVDAWQAKQYDVAVREWQPLAEKGDPDAQFNMGQAYKLGRGVAADLAVAQTWYQKAAEQGHQQAQANLGLILFQNGERAKAMPWIQRAAENDDPRAQYVLGTALFNGDIVTKDWVRAYAMMTRAAAQGLPQATASLTQMDEYIPIEDRQKGIELAQAKQANPASVATAERPAPPRTASQTPPPVITSARPAPARTATSPAAPAATQQPSKVAASTPKPAPTRPAPTSLASAGGKWRVQLGAFGSRDIARTQWAALSKKITALAGLQPSYEPVGTLTRLRVGPLANRAAADKLCAAAKAGGQACFAVAP